MFLILFLISTGLIFLSKIKPFPELWLKYFYRPLSGNIALISGFVPFSMSEILIYLSIAYIVFELFKILKALKSGLCMKISRDFSKEDSRDFPKEISADFPKEESREFPKEISIDFFKELKRSLLGIFSLLSVMFFLYTVNCGINYHLKSFQEEMEEYGYLSDEKAELQSLMTIICDGIKNEDLFVGEMPDIREIRDESRQAESHLGDVFPGLSGEYPSPKPLIFSRLLSMQGITGIYLPFFVEANYNRDMPGYNLPFTMCHELSHLRGYMREDEANFISALALINSDDHYMRFSGYLSLFVYAGNDYYKEDPEGYMEFYRNLPERARLELKENNDFWDKYETGMSEVQDRVNDAYLKANGQTEGIRSYELVTELFLRLLKKKGRILL